MLHRGAGKTILAVNELIKRAMECTDKSGSQFVYIAPEKAQAKNVAWAKLKHYTKNIPDLKIREDELTITFPHNNATICLEGADNPDRMRGRHPHFVIMDEVGQMKRDMWYEVVMPGTMAHSAPVLFIGTPKGDNLFKEMYDLSVSEQVNKEDWFSTILSIYETGRYSVSEIELIKRTQPQAKFEQEYLCSFDANFTGAYYSDLLFNEDWRLVGDYDYNPMYPVITGWDLGTADYTCIWFAQQDSTGKITVFDYYQNNNQDIYHYINYVKNKPYIYDYHILPHDSVQRTWQSLTTRASILKQHGLKVVVAAKLSIQEGIAVVQAALYNCRFNKNKCKIGLRELAAYRSKADKVTGNETGEPVHNDAADAFKTLIVGLKKPKASSTVSNNILDWFDERNGQSKNQQTVGTYDYFNF